MTETTRIEDLKAAREQLAVYEHAMHTAKTVSKKLKAADQVEFWGNKVSFLGAVRGD